jgi:hypothetical protein
VGEEPDEGYTPAEIIVNPYYAIEIEPRLAVPHKPRVTEDEWIAANLQLIEELGPENYLRKLLSALKGMYWHSENANPQPSDP